MDEELTVTNRYRSLADIAAMYEMLARKYLRAAPRGKIDQAFNKGQASAFLAAGDILRRAVIDPDVS